MRREKITEYGHIMRNFTICIYSSVMRMEKITEYSHIMRNFTICIYVYGYKEGQCHEDGENYRI
jgi:hypothetical protein